MWFVIGVAVGYFIHKIFDLFDRIVEKNVSLEEDRDVVDRPHGKPITFNEWEKKNNLF